MTTRKVYAGFDALLTAICKNRENVDDDLEFVIERIEKLPEYFNVVITSELSIRMAYMRYEGDAERIRDTVENIDRTRREKHISLTNSINQLNRMCDVHNIPRIFETGRSIDLNPELKEDREIATDLCYNFCKDVFLDSKTREAMRAKDSSDFTATQRDEELFVISNTHQGTFRHEIMQKVDIEDIKAGYPVQTLIKEAETTEHVRQNCNQEALEYETR